MDKIAAHGPMIPDDKHGTYYRVREANAVIDDLEAQVRLLKLEIMNLRYMLDDPQGLEQDDHK